MATVTSELGGEKIDIIDWSEDNKAFIEEALSPAKVIDVALLEADKQATVTVSEDQQSLAIGKGGQNVRLAAKLTGWRIDIKSVKGDEIGGADAEVMENKKEEKTQEGDISVAMEEKMAEEKTE